MKKYFYSVQMLLLCLLLASCQAITPSTNQLAKLSINLPLLREVSNVGGSVLPNSSDVTFILPHETIFIDGNYRKGLNNLPLLDKISNYAYSSNIKEIKIYGYGNKLLAINASIKETNRQAELVASYLWSRQLTNNIPTKISFYGLGNKSSINNNSNSEEIMANSRIEIVCLR